jgi:hypothetical protein
MRQYQPEDLDHFFTYGEVYDALDVCQDLELVLARLQRHGLLSGHDLDQCKRRITEVRDAIEGALPEGEPRSRRPWRPTLRW